MRAALVWTALALACGCTTPRPPLEPAAVAAPAEQQPDAAGEAPNPEGEPQTTATDTAPDTAEQQPGAAGEVQDPEGEPQTTTPDTAPDTAQDEPRPGGLVRGAGEKVGRGREWVSGNVTAAAAWLDSFSGNERYEAEANQTQVRLRLDTFLEEDEDPDLKARVQVRISLPSTENRLQLIVAGNPEDDLSGEVDPLEEFEVVPEDESDERATFGAEYFLLRGLRHNVRFEGNVRVKDSELVYRVGARYRQNIPLERWLLRFTERLRWESQDGVESRTSVDFDRLLNELFFLRMTTVLQLEEQEDGAAYGQAFTLSQRVGNNKLLSYVWANDFETEPEHILKVTRLRLRYRQPVFTKWTYFEVAPEVRFREVEDYEAGFAILFRLDLFFGGSDYYR